MRSLFLAVVVVALSVASLAVAKTERFTVVFLNPGGATSFWGMVADTMTAAADDLSIDLEVINTDRDRIAMLAAARDIAKRADKPDYVVLVNELEQGMAMQREMNRAGIKTFYLLNRLSDDQLAEFGPSESSTVVGSITPDNEIAGYEMAKSLILEAKRRLTAIDSIRIMAILGDTVTPAALEREAGLRRALAEEPSARLVRAFPVLWNKDEARRRASFALKVEKVDGIWAANDDLAIGAQEAASAMGRRPGEDLLFAGLNWSSDGLAAVQSGAMTMTHGGHFFGGAWAMVMLRDMAEGSAEPGNYRFDMSAVHAKNVDLFIERIGDRDWGKIDFKTFSRSMGGRKSYDFCADAILAAATLPIE
ncbi:MAG: ABC transporter substrate-binding protein [Rhodobacteraceae bacterium]|nr:ABC transporter substrate-binding protein [Paracoccaceae bacterium]